MDSGWPQLLKTALLNPLLASSCTPKRILYHIRKTGLRIWSQKWANKTKKSNVLLYGIHRQHQTLSSQKQHISEAKLFGINIHVLIYGNQSALLFRIERCPQFLTYCITLIDKTHLKETSTAPRCCAFSHSSSCSFASAEYWKHLTNFNAFKHMSQYYISL